MYLHTPQKQYMYIYVHTHTHIPPGERSKTAASPAQYMYVYTNTHTHHRDSKYVYKHTHIRINTYQQASDPNQQHQRPLAVPSHRDRVSQSH